MPTYKTPGVYVEEVASGVRPVQPVGTSTAAFVGRAPRADAPVDTPTLVVNWLDFRRRFVDDPDTGEAAGPTTALVLAVFGFFANAGTRCYVVHVAGGDGSVPGEPGSGEGIDALSSIDDVQIVAAPGYADPVSHNRLLDHCEQHRDRVAILDGPAEVEDLTALTRVAGADAPAAPATPSDDDADDESDTPRRRTAPAERPASLRPKVSPNGYGTFYVPWLRVTDPLAGGSETIACPPSGHVAGVWARVDGRRGVHKAPANEPIAGVVGPTRHIGSAEQELLNPAGVNCIRFFRDRGTLIWGARTLAEESSEWRYLNVRRLFTMIEESIARSTRWIVFEPNGPTLWKSVERDISAFLTTLWRDGALAGTRAEEAFFVKCDAETNPPDSVDLGRVVTLVGVAPLKPAEFVIFRVSQHEAGADVEGA